MSTWPVLVLGIYLGYLVYLSTWSTVLDPNSGVQWLTVYSDWQCIMTDSVYDRQCTVTDSVQWLTVYSDWQCTVTDSAEWLTVYSDWQCTVTDSVQWQTVYNDWQCTMTDSV